MSLTPGGAGVLTLFFPGVLVALATAQRPLAALSLGAAVVLVVNVLWARLALGRLTVAIEGPAVATVGTAVALSVTIAGRYGLNTVLSVDGAVQPAVAARVPGAGPVLWRASRRSVVRQLAVRIQATVPLGLTAVTRVSTVPLTGPEGRFAGIHAAPAAEAVDLPAPPAQAGGPGPLEPGDPLGLRRYRIGDISRDVHWPTVARTGTLMVKDRQEPGGDARIAVVAATGSASAETVAVDRVAAQVRAVVEGLLDRGHRVVLWTWEWDPGGDPTGPARMVTAPVLTRDDLLRRLARLTTGPDQGDREPGGSGPDPVLVVDGAGARWR